MQPRPTSVKSRRLSPNAFHRHKRLSLVWKHANPDSFRVGESRKWKQVRWVVGTQTRLLCASPPHRVQMCINAAVQTASPHPPQPTREAKARSGAPAAASPRAVAQGAAPSPAHLRTARRRLPRQLHFRPETPSNPPRSTSGVTGNTLREGEREREKGR